MCQQKFVRSMNSKRTKNPDQPGLMMPSVLPAMAEKVFWPEVLVVLVAVQRLFVAQPFERRLVVLLFAELLSVVRLVQQRLFVVQPFAQQLVVLLVVELLFQRRLFRQRLSERRPVVQLFAGQLSVERPFVQRLVVVPISELLLSPLHHYQTKLFVPIWIENVH